MKDRIKRIDLLKCIALCMIIIAHVSPPEVIFQIRNFDVVLMLMISTFLYLNSNNKFKFDLKNYSKYIIKRIKRLLIPTWVFLIFFFGISFLKQPYPFSLKEIVYSFSLHGGIGYVWIIRIYLLVAILIPLVDKFIINKQKKNIYYIFFGIVYIIYELLCYKGFFDTNIIFEDFFAYIIPLISIILITDWIKNNTSKKILLFSFINMLIYVVLAYIIYKLTGRIETTNYMKYPFRLYYLSYAFSSSGILIIIFRINKVTDFLYNKLIALISKSSLWIYLWHIIYIYSINEFCKDINWIFKFIIVFVCAVLTTYIQNIALDKVNTNNKILDIFRG